MEYDLGKGKCAGQGEQQLLGGRTSGPNESRVTKGSPSKSLAMCLRSIAGVAGLPRA